MKFVSIDQYFRKRSGASSLFLHIPTINYLAFLFQIRGSYIAVKNYCYLNQELASIGKVLFISIRYALFSALASSLIYFLLLFAFDINFHGEMVSFYISFFGDFLAPICDVEFAGTIFAEIPHEIKKIGFSNYAMTLNVFFIFASYVLFGLVGGFWAQFNIKSDLKRANINKPLFDVEQQSKVIY